MVCSGFGVRVQFSKTGTKVFGKRMVTAHIHLELVLGCPFLFGAIFWRCGGLGGLDLGGWYLGGLVPGVAKGVSSCIDSAPKIAKPLQTTQNHYKPLRLQKRG